MTEQVRGDPGREFVRLIGPADAEPGCDECFDQLDAYVEIELTSVSADITMPAMRPHFAGCSACCDDHDSLLALVRTDGTSGA